jgi:hypothetical protein
MYKNVQLFAIMFLTDNQQLHLILNVKKLYFLNSKNRRIKYFIIQLLKINNYSFLVTNIKILIHIERFENSLIFALLYFNKDSL